MPVSGVIIASWCDHCMKKRASCVLCDDGVYSWGCPLWLVGSVWRCAELCAVDY